MQRVFNGFFNFFFEVTVMKCHLKYVTSVGARKMNMKDSITQKHASITININDLYIC